jgi:hypothetical protein
MEPRRAPQLTEAETLPMVGRFVFDPATGVDCPVTLGNGEKILVSHDQGGFEGGRVDTQDPGSGGLVR